MREDSMRKPHADINNMPLRTLKARKIEILLGLDAFQGGGRLLEVGTGSGGIAYYFAHHAHASWDVVAVDVVDNRQLQEGYKFQLITGCELPFGSDSFDVVISNHVIEHVGDESNQLLHLKELRRVLKPEGRGYMAVPNRWMLIEPHFRLPLLSWLPVRLSHAYVRAAGRGTHYDCQPPTCARIESMLSATSFEWRQCTGKALRLTYELERPDALVHRWLLRRIPERMFEAVRRVFPTLIYILTKR